MSETVAIGLARSIDGPLPIPRPYSLLETLEKLGTEANPLVIRRPGRDLNGVTVWGFPTETPSLWENCLPGTFAEKDSESTWDQPTFNSLAAYLPITCSTISANPEEFRRRAEIVLDATLSFAVEEALAKFVPGSTNPNPYLGDNTLVVVGGATNSAQVGLSFLENALGTTGRGGIIHATPGTVAAWNYVNLLTDSGGVLRTTNGTPVVSGAGYIDTDPVGETGSTPTSGIEWAFATGPVMVFIADGPDLRVSQYVDRADNVITYRAEKFILPLWDTSAHFGTLIDWTP